MADETLSACLAEIKANDGKFYVYILFRPDGRPLYVGCGKVHRHRQRIEFHEKDAREGGVGHKCNAIRAIWWRGGTVSYSIDSWHPTEADMFAREIALIALFGRADKRTGPLTNQTDGGEGLINRADEVRQRARESTLKQVDDEFRRESSKRLKQNWASPEGRRKREAANARPEVKERQRRAAKLVSADPVVQAKRSETMAERWKDAEYQERQAAAHQAAMGLAEYRRNAALRASSRWADPEYQARLSAVHQRNWQDEEFRERMNNATAARNSEEANRKKGAAAKERWSDPEYAARVKKAQCEAWVRRKARDHQK